MIRSLACTSAACAAQATGAANVVGSVSQTVTNAGATVGSTLSGVAGAAGGQVQSAGSAATGVIKKVSTGTGRAVTRRPRRSPP